MPNLIIMSRFFFFKKLRPLWRNACWNFVSWSDCYKSNQSINVWKSKLCIYVYESLTDPSGSAELVSSCFMSEHNELNILTEFHPFVKMPCCFWFMSTSKHRLGRAALSLWPERCYTYFEWNIKWNRLRNRMRGRCLRELWLYRPFRHVTMNSAALRMFHTPCF